MLQKFKKDYPRFKSLFSFQEFNQVQNQCYPKIFNSTENMIISAPTSSGKTVIFQLLIAKLITQNKSKFLYLAPIKSLCHEKASKWKSKFMSFMHIMELTGDSLEIQQTQIDHADLIIGTPQKIDYISRKNLNFLKKLNLLLIDQIHMLNMEDRGAILQAIVSRIMSINKNIRIVAVSATIPNIQEVAQWLKVPKSLVCVFGPQYRPAKLHKVVLGFKSINNDFNFQKMLNFKILEVIRNYSYGKGTLIFCQTQKGTQQACNKIISTANPREFIENQFDSVLINSAKNVQNTTLKNMITHGVAFHNAGLSMKDRNLVQKLFLDFKIKVLCTTSTLAMGVNLPARLVIIKSTKCYKGAGKGYQQYSQIQLDQMMGRAGRIPFDKEGTVVIMTQKQNYNKYVGQIKLQNLQSQLYTQFIDHLNTQISLKSIQSLNQTISYFQNSFCYIRMGNSPKSYNIASRSEVDKFVKNICLSSIKKLSQYKIIEYLQSNEKIYPHLCSHNISKNAVEVDTITKVIQRLNKLNSQKDFINLLCSANQFLKYRSKLDERKVLKALNEKNKYCLRQSISTSEKKLFVLVQAFLSGIHIENWQLRRQANQSISFFKRFSYCIKSLALQRKFSNETFWIYLYSCLFHKYFSLGFWQLNDQKVLRQFNIVQNKWSNIHARGIRNVSDLMNSLNKLQVFGTNASSISLKNTIERELGLLNDCLLLSISKVSKQKPLQDQIQDSNNFKNKPQLKQTNHLLKIIFNKDFTEKFKSINIIIEHKDTIYHSGIMNQANKQFTVYLKNTLSQKYFIAIIKEGYVGFDQFYSCEYGTIRKTELKDQEPNKKNIRSQSLGNSLQKNKRSQKLENRQIQNNSIQKKLKRNSLDSKMKVMRKKSHIKNSIKIPRQIKFNPKLNSNKHPTSSQSFMKNQNRNDYSSNFKSTVSTRQTEPYSSKLQVEDQNYDRRIQLQNDYSDNKQDGDFNYSNYNPKEIILQEPGLYNHDNEQYDFDYQNQAIPASYSKVFSNDDSTNPSTLSTLKINKKSKQLKLAQSFNTIKRKYIYDVQSEKKRNQENPLGKSLKKLNDINYRYNDLKSYNWKPGFQQIKDEQINSYAKNPFYKKNQIIFAQNQKSQIKTDVKQQLNQFMQQKLDNHPHFKKYFQKDYEESSQKNYHNQAQSNGNRNLNSSNNNKNNNFMMKNDFDINKLDSKAELEKNSIIKKNTNKVKQANNFKQTKNNEYAKKKAEEDAKRKQQLNNYLKKYQKKQYKNQKKQQKQPQFSYKKANQVPKLRLVGSQSSSNSDQDFISSKQKKITPMYNFNIKLKQTKSNFQNFNQIRQRKNTSFGSKGNTSFYEQALEDVNRRYGQNLQSEQNIDNQYLDTNYIKKQSGNYHYPSYITKNNQGYISQDKLFSKNLQSKQNSFQNISKKNNYIHNSEGQKIKDFFGEKPNHLFGYNQPKINPLRQFKGPSPTNDLNVTKTNKSVNILKQSSGWHPGNIKRKQQIYSYFDNLLNEEQEFDD